MDAAKSALGAKQQMLAVQAIQNANQQFEARRSVGRAIQQATNPTAGMVDEAIAQRLISQDPDAASAAEGAATTGQALRAERTKFNTEQRGQIAWGVGAMLSQSDAQ
jgi:hypothetical protein